MLGNVLGWFDSILRWFVAVPAQDVSNVIALTHLTRNAIDCVFVQFVGECICCRLSPYFVNSVISLLTGSFEVYTSYCSANFAYDTAGARSIETVFWIPTPSIVIVVSNTYISLQSSVQGGVSSFFDSDARGSAVNGVTGRRSRYMYCPTENDSGVFRVFWSQPCLFWPCDGFIPLSAFWRNVATRYSSLTTKVCRNVVAVASVGSAVG